MATVGGNVANASPCGDSIPALLALDAEVEVWDAAGQARRSRSRTVLAGAGRTTLGLGEAIAGFAFAALDGGFARRSSRSARARRCRSRG